MPSEVQPPSMVADMRSTSPAMDDPPLGRQKRKRTSPEDQVTLEAAYQRDPKPDKTARQELVKLVAMGEKEVQIWFQNRRQSSRRKSRPLLPHEVAQYHAARTGQSSEYGPTHEPDMNPESDDSNATIADDSISEAVRGTVSAGDRDAIHGSHASSLVEKVLLPSSQALRRASSTSQLPSSTFVATVAGNAGYLSNKRRASAMQPHRDMSSISSGRMFVGTSDPVLKKSSSVVRLAMAADGAAHISTKDGSSPSPPRPLPVTQAAFDPSAGSAVGALDLGRSTSSGHSVRRSVSGRSRDARAWEFWCDKDSRTELEGRSAQDESGSASNAIGLMRATSGRSILGPLSGKRNLGLHRTTSAKRAKLEEAQPGLLRSSTSSGRLQQGRHENASTRAPKLRYSLSTAQIIIPGNDSDKENWSPDRSESFDKSVGKGVLSEKRGAVNATRSGRKQSPLKPRLQRTGDGENADPEADPELAAFMRTDRRSRSISGDEELDCVQGLLSLSQGAWR